MGPNTTSKFETRWGEHQLAVIQNSHEAKASENADKEIFRKQQLKEKEMAEKIERLEKQLKEQGR